MALLLGVCLVVAPSASAVSTRPTTAAIAHWKQIVFKPAALSPFWRGFVGGGNPRLTGCKYLSSKGVTFYDCHVKITGGTEVAVAALVRTARCSYHYELAQESPSGQHHDLQRTMRFCG